MSEMTLPAAKHLLPHFVTVAIPTRNGAGRLPRLLAALRDQSYPLESFEVLVVNNGSSDQTADVVGNAARQGALTIRHVIEAKRGVNHARNRAIAESPGEFLAFVDDDEIPGPRWLESLVDGMRRFPASGCIGGPVMARPARETSPRTCDRCDVAEGNFSLDIVEGAADVVGGGNAIFRRSALEAVGEFNSALSGHGDDYEWMLRSRAAGFLVYYIAAASVVHVRDQVTARAYLKKSFLRAFSAAEFEAMTGLPHPDPASVVSRIPRYLAHSVRYRCWGGVAQTCGAVGRAIGVVRARKRGRHGGMCPTSGTAPGPRASWRGKRCHGIGAGHPAAKSRRTSA
jgi:glycosyltransferase involved in cell wall biosynthesis